MYLSLITFTRCNSDPDLTDLVSWPHICPITMNLPDDLDSWLNLAVTPGPTLLPLLGYCRTGPGCQGPCPAGMLLHLTPHPLGSSWPSLFSDTLYHCSQWVWVPAYCSGFAWSLCHSHKSECLFVKKNKNKNKQKKPKPKTQTKTPKTRNLKTPVYDHWLKSSEIPKVADTYLVQSSQHLLKLMLLLELGHLQLASCCTIIFFISFPDSDLWWRYNPDTWWHKK